MISNLHIENVAIMDNVDIEFKKGYLVLTGETGAGKSIIIDSVNLLTGERSSKEIVRHGAEKAVVEGVVYPEDESVTDILKENGIECYEGDPVILRREIRKDGKNLVRINGKVSTTGLLREICSKIINIHGQNDNQEILNVAYHGEILDRYLKLEKDLSEYLAVYKQYKEKKAYLAGLLDREQETAEKREIITYKIEEIENAELKPGEYDSLKQQREKYLNTEKITDAANRCFFALSGTDTERGIGELVSECLDSLEILSSFDPSFKDSFENLNDIKYSLADIEENVSDFRNNFDGEGIDINSIEQRIDVISNLKRKYGETEEEILDLLSRLKEEREISENFDAVKAGLEKEISKLNEEIFLRGSEISKKRKKGALELEKLINSQLSDLEMDNARFKVNFEDIQPSERGIEKIEFLISTNKGEPLKPMCKIASGGELSRIILALKVVLSDTDKVSAMVFDEVDSGVSGSAAEKIAQKIKSVSKNKQVFVITHLPQVASFADYHYRVRKTENGGKTTSTVTLLDRNERITELARLISGSVIKESALKAAEEMLENRDKQI